MTSDSTETAPQLKDTQHAPLPSNVVDRLLNWLDHHPRTIQTLRIIATGVSAMVSLTLRAIAGAVTGAVLFALPNLWWMFDRPEVSLPFINGFAFVGAVIALIIGSYRWGKSLSWGAKDEHLFTRAMYARSCVARAVVAHHLGVEVKSLKLGLAGGFALWCSFRREYDSPGMVETSGSYVDTLRDELVITLADPEVVRRSIFDDSRIREIHKHISGLVDQLTVLQEYEIARNPGRIRVDYLASAAHEAASILARHRDADLERIETELMRSTAMRGQRFTQLMGEIEAAQSGEGRR